MVAAKPDHSRVLVTKFHQNRSTLKGRSAGQRQTHRKTLVKIMALQACNRANTSNELKLRRHIMQQVKKKLRHNTEGNHTLINTG